MFNKQGNSAQNLMLKHRLNDQIRVPNVRLIMDGRNMGVVPTRDARSLADSKGLDLVEVAPKERPPVCQILDYGKFCYEQQKKARNDKSNKVDFKEIRLTAGTDAHDVETKIKQLRHFIEQGKYVKILIKYKNRQIVHADVGFKVMDQMLDSIKDIAKTDYKPKMEGKSLIAQVIPLA